ncbi:MAG: DJ-1/PfpI family protein [Limosilactobacillus sp.]|jgi:4-methyl-5(b-hydroxyethyl)-thiazole monophosphate biosynthesis|uniref:DJ-1 family glyoxalase III n=1 Tax=Limosilactobacillus sp. TaxID=2773925 RepID=UPI0025BC0AB3|nr:DJ-1 family glyoxalase III [Limosilactobacillus sp.]MCI1974584.1 DJ-1/PfpI family protein [Limosilactobacillus sp.]MCI2031650.1 DJ-1/PfpI family protein [Limosilactobacillus sp.]
MKKVAVVFAPGCEEVEGLTVVDVLRRLGVETKMVGLENQEVLGAHNIKLTCDEVLGDQLLDYDLVAFPGGMGGSERLRDNEQLKQLMVQRNKEGKWDAAMCAAPIALARYGLLDNHDYTCYPGMNEVIQKEAPTARFHEEITVVDEQAKILTSRGPATALAYAFKIAELMGVDTKQIKKDMLYDYLAQNI